ncbi:Transmembrane family 220, helix [Parapedobacter composti]|uniref:Transmembrane family 220, helix n=1 Tax=Parapedobacter composti TaxID=623281 RepID=A0A1I1G535_9SPHI|nr:transmembrane 220 family protein [Parapedobacter composti]SFC04938.1 Transmembrane family 220, helix [Parapedobacter composti]
MKLFNIAFCILFVISAAVQYNDADPYIWIPLYLYGAWLCYEAAKGRCRPRAYGAGIFVYLLFILYFLFFKQGVIDWFQYHPAKDLVKSMKADRPWIEETREVMGLTILIAVLAINWIASKPRRIPSA